MDPPEKPDLWDDADVVHIYSRAEGLVDGTLVDIPVALTATVHSALVAH